MLIKEINQYYTEQNGRAYDGSLHVSEACKCPRELYYHSQGIKKSNELTPVIKRVFANGDSFHRRMMRTLFGCKNIRVVSSEIPIAENGIVRGTMDAVIALNGENIIVDFKSINTFGFKKLLEENKPKKEHVVQVQLYLHFTGIKKAIVLYEDKNSQELLEFVVEYDNALVTRVLKKLMNLKEDIFEKRLPNKVESFEDQWMCSYCGYKTKCQKNENV